MFIIPLSREVSLCAGIPFFEFVSSSDLSACIVEFILSVSELASGIYCMDPTGRIRFVPYFACTYARMADVWRDFFRYFFCFGLDKGGIWV